VSVVQHSKYVVIVTPLGKILRLCNVSQLNELLPENPAQLYNAYELRSFGEQPRNIFLHTTLRSNASLSPFRNLSTLLKSVRDQGTSLNYVLCEDCEEFEPSGDRWAVILTELPRQYIRRNFDRAYMDELR